MSIIVAAFAAAILMLSVSTPATAAKKMVCRDAKTGAYVSAAYAKKYPGLTVCEAKK